MYEDTQFRYGMYFNSISIFKTIIRSIFIERTIQHEALQESIIQHKALQDICRESIHLVFKTKRPESKCRCLMYLIISKPDLLIQIFKYSMYGLSKFIFMFIYSYVSHTYLQSSQKYQFLLQGSTIKKKKKQKIQ